MTVPKLPTNKCLSSAGRLLVCVFLTLSALLLPIQPYGGDANPSRQMGTNAWQSALLTPAVYAADGGSVAANKAPIKIGLLTSASGINNLNGQDLINGLKLYLEQANGRIAGRKVELVVEDDGGQISIATANFHKLVDQDKVQVVIAGVITRLAYALAPLADKAEVPMLYPMAGADDLTQRKPHKWVIVTGAASSQSMHPFGQWVYKTLGYKNTIVAAMDYQFGWESVGGFQEAFEEAGGRVVQKIWAGIKVTDFLPFISSMQKSGDAVLDVNVGNGSIPFLKQYAQSGPKLPIVAAGPSFEERLLDKMGDGALGALSAGIYCPSLDTPENKRFVKAFIEHYKDEPSYYAESCYTTGIWINQAAEAVHGNLEDKEALLAALKKVSIAHAPRGPISVDRYGCPIENIYVRKVEKVNGKLQNTVIHTFNNVSQFWHWKPEEYLSRPEYSSSYPPCKYCSK